MPHPPSTEYAKRTAWFHQARFGVFLHWGLYSLLGRGEWSMFVERIPVNEYARLADRFRAPRFDADEWARRVRDAGARYAVFTTRHHDGFCLFDSATTEFTSTRTAARRDFVAHFVRACRKAGLRVGLYYSLMDWRYRGYFRYPRDASSRHAMVRQAHEQVRELMTNYGRIDVLWYDGNWMNHDVATCDKAAELWRARELNAMVRSLQPGILINNRAGTREDLDTPEQAVKASKPGRAWESCMTIGDFFGWGYLRHSPNRKPAAQLLQSLIYAAAGEGNLLLNLAPRPDGSLHPQETRRIEAIGGWLAGHGESIYGSRRSPLYDGWFNLWTGDGRDPCVHYWHLLRWPGARAVFAPCRTPVREARLMGDGRPLRVEQDDEGRLCFAGLPARPPHPLVSVIRVRFAKPPSRHQPPDRASWLGDAAS